jgi:hypothetical protein
MSKFPKLDLQSAFLNFAKRLPNEEQDLLLDWLVELLAINASERSRKEKAQDAIRVTRDRKAVWPILKGLKDLIKQHGWDERGKGAKWGMVGAGAAIGFFGFQGAGIAALGGAIGVPLWVVLGGGAAAASVVHDELVSRKASRSADNN